MREDEEKPAPPDSFETSTERLTKIVEQLERGDLPLEKSLELFEEGVSLARRAQAQLDRAERRVEELLGFDPNGKPVTRDMTAATPGGTKQGGAAP